MAANDDHDVAAPASATSSPKAAACRYCLTPLTTEHFRTRNGLCDWCSLPEQIFVAWECGCASTFPTREYPVACPTHHKLFTRIATVKSL